MNKVLKRHKSEFMAIGVTKLRLPLRVRGYQKEFLSDAKFFESSSMSDEINMEWFGGIYRGNSRGNGVRH